MLFLEAPNGRIRVAWGGAFFQEAEGKDRFENLKDGIRYFESNIPDSTNVPPWSIVSSFFSDKHSSDKENPWARLPNTMVFLPKLFIETDGKGTGHLISFSDPDANPFWDESSVRLAINSGRDLNSSSFLIEENDHKDLEKVLWFQNCNDILNEISSNEVSKIVLSRQIKFDVSSTDSIVTAWSRLFQSDHPHAFKYCVAFNES